MTIEELSQLSDEELRVKVAEKLGYYRDLYTGMWEGGPIRVDFILPPFSTSLDAIHEAEKTLNTDKQKDEFSDHLMRIMDDVFPLWHATARQRAIAFLLV